MSINKPLEEAKRLKVVRSTINVLVDQEDMPCTVLRETISKNGRRRRVIRFDTDEVDRWLAGRRQRQLRDFNRYSRRGRA